eukprot:CAMPEP_0206469852 /NCGR_PEP_ID=MMETSP0324_2-20121206/30549_1 /ASSEMBLY_ACC=CAM_ASM_000836 /TAXON_ID=2866 /ORGANISM="Crypthecodinium cohnii, Strain Seligo" /LENGTH=383 /DNA_ID=CAMNT_0053943735 /DNA_START=49 /DNA_END=1200 /DNA_ORIENTATION=+
MRSNRMQTILNQVLLGGAPSRLGSVALASGGSARPACSAVVVHEFGAPEVMKVEQKALPTLGPGQVLVNIKAAGVNPSDTYIRLGPEGPYAATPHLLPKLPFTPGKTGAGVVVSLGESVASVKVGDRVYVHAALTGTYASHAVCDAETLEILPAAVSYAQGATLGVAGSTAYYALCQRGGLRDPLLAPPGAEKEACNILVHGASGSVGLAAVQLARAITTGTVAGTAGTDQGGAAASAAGAAVVANHRSESYVDDLRKAVPGGFDLILEMFGHVNLPTDLALASKRGKICIIGSRSQTVPVNPRHFMNVEAEVRGVFLPQATAEDRKTIARGLRMHLENGTLKPVIGQEMPLADAARAHKEVMAPSSGGAAGSIVLIPDDQDD